MPVLPLGADAFGSMRIATTVPVNASLTATMGRVTFRSNTARTRPAKPLRSSPTMPAR